jgi:undecaprenyl pyrophosphate phosphatase UppP
LIYIFLIFLFKVGKLFTCFLWLKYLGHLLKTPFSFTSHELLLLGSGLAIAFITAWLAVKVFLKLVENYGFRYFGYYRILIGIAFLLLTQVLADYF